MREHAPVNPALLIGIYLLSAGIGVYIVVKLGERQAARDSG